jgi:hypothetical protein
MIPSYGKFFLLAYEAAPQMVWGAAGILAVALVCGLIYVNRGD